MLVLVILTKSKKCDSQSIKSNYSVILSSAKVTRLVKKLRIV